VKRTFITLSAGLLLTFILSVTGNSEVSSSGAPEAKTARSLQGTWKEKNCDMGFAIDGNKLTEYKSVPSGTLLFAGVIVNHPDLSAEHGLIIVKLTDVGTSAASGGAVGKFTVARWKTFTGDAVGQTNAKDANYRPIFYATEAEAAALTEASPELDRFCCEVCNRM
jgi:hypothetical protein